MKSKRVKRWTAGALAIILLAPLAGCGYGEVSGAAYDYAMALYSITNRRAEAKLDGVESQIAAAADQGEISAQEAEWLLEIVGDARRGEWRTANRAARRMMEDQIKRP